MLYQLAHIIQARCPWIWELVEHLNATVFSWRVGERRKRMGSCLSEGIRLARKEDAEALAAFFARQPEESYRWFQPHAFDVKTMRTLLGRKSYILYVAEEQGEMIGYAFLRCFLNGKCFLGKMVDSHHRGKGVCTRLCADGMAMANALGLRMFESINKDNVGSLKASQKACDVVVVEELEGGDILIEDRMKTNK